jgi:hypothetical protein
MGMTRDTRYTLVERRAACAVWGLECEWAHKPQRGARASADAGARLTSTSSALGRVDVLGRRKCETSAMCTPISHSSSPSGCAQWATHDANHPRAEGKAGSNGTTACPPASRR